MLTLYYIAATWVQSWRLSTTLIKIRSVFTRNGSVIVHQELPPYIYVTGTAQQQRLEVNSVLSKQCSNHNVANIGDLLWYTSNKRLVSVYPKQVLDISGWIQVIPGKTHLPLQFKGLKTNIQDNESKIYLLLEADYNTCQYQIETHVLELERYGIPKAWFAGSNMSILMETDEIHLAALCVAFQNDVTLENGIQIIRFETVSVTGTPYRILNVSTVPESYAPLNPDLDRAHMKESFMSRWRAHVSMLCTFCDAVGQVKESLQDISVRHPGSGVGAVKLIPTLVDKGVTDLMDIGVKNSESIDKISMDEVITSEASNNALVEPSSPSSVTSLSRISTDTMQVAPGSTAKLESVSASLASLPSLPTTPRRTVRTTNTEGPIKPPNILVFSDSSTSAETIKSALEVVLLKNKYTMHTLNYSDVCLPEWFYQASLVIVHGNAPKDFTNIIMDYYLTLGGSLLCLCSDLLGSILPVFSTAEVRPNELVRCSYKSWKHVSLLHHVFCYQPLPPAPKFSNDDLKSFLPTSVNIKDKDGQDHNLKVEVLGSEETWNTPSLILVSSSSSSARIIFSQVHLEVEPSQYENDETKLLALQKSDKARLEILCDVLSNHLAIQCSLQQSNINYSPAYFLGKHEGKQELLDRLHEEGFLDGNNILDCGDLTLKFCGKGVIPPMATQSQLPVLIHACPESFSTVDYFENLKTEYCGRLVIYSHVMTSSMFLTKCPPMSHGFTVIPDYQTKGIGRGGNAWLSPEGCAMFTIQLHIPMKSYIGQHLSLLQHLCSVAVVSAICQLPGLEDLDIGLKWPNDIYANKSSKIGGVTVSSTVTQDTAICNIGCGLNLFNKEPTICINELVKSINKDMRGKIPLVTREKYFTEVFNVFEELYNKAQNGQIEEVYLQYYKYWLHTDAEIQVKNSEGAIKLVKIKGIDSFGFLAVETMDGNEIVLQPDGNSFDMMAGLIMPKMK